MLEGLMSRWMRLLACRWVRAEKREWMVFFARGVVRGGV